MKTSKFLLNLVAAVALASLPVAASVPKTQPQTRALKIKLNVEALLHNAGHSRLLADWDDWCAHGGHGGHEPVIIILDNTEMCVEFCGNPPDCSDGDAVNKRWVPDQRPVRLPPTFPNPKPRV